MVFFSQTDVISIHFPKILYFYYRDQLTDDQYPEPSLLLPVFQPSDVVSFQWIFSCGQDPSSVMWSYASGLFLVDKIPAQSPSRGHFLVDKIPAQSPSRGHFLVDTFKFISWGHLYVFVDKASAFTTLFYQYLFCIPFLECFLMADQLCYIYLLCYKWLYCASLGNESLNLADMCVCGVECFCRQNPIQIYLLCCVRDRSCIMYIYQCKYISSH